MSRPEQCPRAFTLDEFTVDPAAGELIGPAGHAQLDPKVMAVLVVLAERAGNVVLREEIFTRVWPDVVVTDDALSRCIYQLRRHLLEAGGSERHRALVETLPKRGYRLHCPLPKPHAEAVTDRRARAAERITDERATATLAARNMLRSKGGKAIFLALMAAAAGAAMIAVARWGDAWRDPLARAAFSRLTDFDGVEHGAAVSRDGSLVAFLSDRGGSTDVWLKDLVSGELRNLTNGGAGEAINPDVRALDFTPDGADVTFWTRSHDSLGNSTIHRRAVSIRGGPTKDYLDNAIEVSWSSDGTRAAYHPATAGDPIFVTEPGERVGRRIFIAPPGLHCHFLLWSPDDLFIYFVYGAVPSETDLWRIPVHGGVPERITTHHSRVSFPVFLDARTLAYLATAEDGSGPWLHTIDVGRRVSRRASSGVDTYASLAATADGRRLVATMTTERTTLWKVPVRPQPASAADASPIELTTAGGSSPRLGPGYLLYLAPNDGNRGLWKLAADATLEIWPGRRGHVAARPTIAPDGREIAFTVTSADRTRLYVAASDGTAVRPLAAQLDVRGQPAWSPDGQWIAVAADRGGGAQLFKIPVDGGSPVALVDELSIDPVWSLDSEFLVYRGAETGPYFPLKAVSASGAAHALPAIVLPRGARSLAFLPDGTGLLVLKGDLGSKDFWVVDLRSGEERRLSSFGADFAVGDFDLAADGAEIIFDRTRTDSDVIMIERPMR